MRKDIVALILEKDGKILVEKRKESKKTTPSSIIFPGGHVNSHENLEDALAREIKEELGIIIYNPRLIYQADFDCEEKQRIYWYGCESYGGEMKMYEAEKLIWIHPIESHLLTHQVSRDALNEYLRKK